MNETDSPNQTAEVVEPVKASKLSKIARGLLGVTAALGVGVAASNIDNSTEVKTGTDTSVPAVAKANKDVDTNPLVSPETTVVTLPAPVAETAVEAPTTTAPETVITPEAVIMTQEPVVSEAPVVEQPAVVHGHEYSENPDGSTSVDSTITAEPAPESNSEEPAVVQGHEYSENPDGTTSMDSTIEAPLPQDETEPPTQP